MVLATQRFPRRTGSRLSFRPLFRRYRPQQLRARQGAFRRPLCCLARSGARFQNSVARPEERQWRRSTSTSSNQCLFPTNHRSHRSGHSLRDTRKELPNSQSMRRQRQESRQITIANAQVGGMAHSAGAFNLSRECGSRRIRTKSTLQRRGDSRHSKTRHANGAKWRSRPNLCFVRLAP